MVWEVGVKGLRYGGENMGMKDMWCRERKDGEGLEMR